MEQQSYTIKELAKLEHDEIVQHCICLQGREKQYKKELVKREKKVEKLTERLVKKEAKKEAKNQEIEIFTGKIPPLVYKITTLSWLIRNKFPFGGKEHHFQAALEMELRDQGYMVSQEVARLLHYTRENGQINQLCHDIRGREDLVLPDEKFILELKQTRTMEDKEHMQLMRYMRERCEHSANWGQETQGMLINFGDDEVEIWWMFYPDANNASINASTTTSKKDGSIARVRIFQEKIPHLSEKHLLFKLPTINICEPIQKGK